ncbi:hypothetical protein APR11_000375 [Nocardia amikacinitolerans]|uniref:hypothetical protein n=1 Tax=Nocardia amikacinitolerans TaxID=756689 RepID=UPI0020A42F78|nr:hypothetical protein [Nocardia amikacinitolerans]MCP2293971.1 hypothetical protein [Nocardia amikacinitolerans]
MTAFWPESEPKWTGEPPEEMRASRLLHAYYEDLKAGRQPQPTAIDVLAHLGGTIVDLEERLVQMQRRLNELSN